MCYPTCLRPVKRRSGGEGDGSRSYTVAQATLWPWLGTKTEPDSAEASALVDAEGDGAGALMACALKLLRPRGAWAVGDWPTAWARGVVSGPRWRAETSEACTVISVQASWPWLRHLTETNAALC